MVSSQLIGIAGAHFVAGELSKRGYLATLTSRNSEGIDILASDKDGVNPISIQVKTSTKKDWILNKKAENLKSERLFYVFVRLHKEDSIPDYYIVPSPVVSEYVSRTHSEWLASKNKKGESHNDTSIRIFKDAENKYKDRWDLLGLN